MFALSKAGNDLQQPCLGLLCLKLHSRTNGRSILRWQPQHAHWASRSLQSGMGHAGLVSGLSVCKRLRRSEWISKWHVAAGGQYHHQPRNGERGASLLMRSLCRITPLKVEFASCRTSSLPTGHAEPAEAWPPQTGCSDGSGCGGRDAARQDLLAVAAGSGPFRRRQLAQLHILW